MHDKHNLDTLRAYITSHTGKPVRQTEVWYVIDHLRSNYVPNMFLVHSGGMEFHIMRNNAKGKRNVVGDITFSRRLWDGEKATWSDASPFVRITGVFNEAKDNPL